MRKGDMDMKKPLVMNAAMRTFGAVVQRMVQHRGGHGIRSWCGLQRDASSSVRGTENSGTIMHMQAVRAGLMDMTAVAADRLTSWVANILVVVLLLDEECSDDKLHYWKYIPVCAWWRWHLTKSNFEKTEQARVEEFEIFADQKWLMINYIIGSLFVFTLDDCDTSQRAR